MKPWRWHLLRLFVIGVSQLVVSSQLISCHIAELAGQEIAASQIPGGMMATAEGEWRPEANDEIERGFASKFYANLAPAVVAIRLPNGHATGLLISHEGWIITNEHVANAGRLNANTGCRELDIHFGQYKDRTMHVDRQTYRAVVYKTDSVNDLALVRLVTQPAYLKAIEPIELEQVTPELHADCMMIGHPTVGMLWSLRTGIITEHGVWPELAVNSLKESFVAIGLSEAQSEVTVSSIPSRSVLVTTCPTEAGDAGSPLFAARGKLIGVSFGATRGRSTQQFDPPNYHTHLAAIKSLVANLPQTPLVQPPTPWPLATSSELQDSDDNGRWDVWQFTNERGEVTGFMLDLDQDTPADFQAAEIADAKNRKRWDFEFAIKLMPVTQVFYDTDNDGELDLVYTDINHDQRSDFTLQKHGAQWQTKEANRSAVIDVELFQSPKIRRQFNELLTK